MILNFAIRTILKQHLKWYRTLIFRNMLFPLLVCHIIRNRKKRANQKSKALVSRCSIQLIKNRRNPKHFLKPFHFLVSFILTSYIQNFSEVKMILPKHLEPNNASDFSKSCTCMLKSRQRIAALIAYCVARKWA